MASIINRKGSYYSRVQWRDEDGIMREKQIPLKTKKKSIAVVRNTSVEKVDDLIRDGENYSFPWMNQDGEVKLIKLSISNAYEEYRNVQNINGIRKSTLDRIDNSMKTLYKVFGRDYPIASLTYSHIEQFKEYWFGKHAPTTMNINLSKIRAFHNWCVKKGYAKKIEFVLVKETPKEISYLSEDEFNGIMQLDVIDLHFRKAFLFYYMTGCRKAEPFKADLNGNWLTIKSADAKAHRTREVQLNPILKGIVTEMQDRFHMLMDEYGQKPRHIINRYGKEFKKACRQLGIKGKTLHNLRDTYAVRRWAITGDIKMVADEIGHASVVMTEKYARCNLRRLQDDFPSLSDRIALRLTPPMEDGYFTNLLQSI
jgi:integrase